MQVSTHAAEVSVAGLLVGKPLGSGASSRVYHATRGKLECVVKVPSRADLTPEQSAAFLREAVTLARIDHPGLARIMEAGWSGNRPYIVMEFVDGEMLASKITAGGLTEKQIVQWMIELADTLSRVHQHGVVHRDIKPKN